MGSNRSGGVRLNILLTTDCSLDCPYCFARPLCAQPSRRELTFSELQTILDILNPERDVVRLMGGEPTLHSQYPEFIKLIKERRFQVVVFTNGLQSVLRETMPDLPDEILLNLNDWSTYTRGQQRAINDNLSALGKRVGLGYTILNPSFDLSMHRKLILAYDLQPLIRLGLAQPVIGSDNAYLLNEDLPAAHQALVGWAKVLSADGLRLSMDCGFMRCLYKEADIEALVRAGTVLNFDCTPTLDVGPGLKVWRCFAFSNNPGVNWSDFETLEELQAWFDAEDSENIHVYDNCEHHLKGWCRGGCLARRIIGDKAEIGNIDQMNNKENVGIKVL
ncbi:MAG: radical SAM protein [Chloroflexota bacterium]|nr:radical SAM protein [Chloroflexota bacterium]